MKYVPGKKYMHPNMPQSILDEIGSCLAADPEDLKERMEEIAGGRGMIEHLEFPKSWGCGVIDTSQLPKEVKVKRTRYYFKKRIFLVHFWECERVQED